MRRFHNKTDREERDHLMRKYEKMAYDAERSGDKITAQTYFQMAENYKRTKEHEQ